MRSIPVLFVIVLYTITSIASLGLKEEFTWTRINYVWPQDRQIRDVHKRQSGSYSGNKRPAGGHGAGILNQQNEGGIDPHRPFGTNAGSNWGNQNQGHSGNNQGSTDVSNSNYIYENNVPMGANLWRNKLFITVPRRRNGVPSTLNFIWLNGTQKHNAPLIPYPDWETNTLAGEHGSHDNRERFVSIYRVAIDECDRLWFVDTGLIEQPGNRRQVQPNKLIVMNLHTSKIVQSYEFPEDQILSSTNLALLAVDSTQNQCDDAYAYIPDLGGYGLIVYSLRGNKSWRLTHNYFYLEPLAGEFFIAGHRFQWNDGIFSVALSPIRNDGYRDLFFHSMAGTHLYSVSTEVLKNETLAARSFHENDFKVLGDRGSGSQTSASDLHKDSGILFLGLVNQNALACWNTLTDLRDISIIQRNNKTMIYPCDVKVSADDVILLTNTMPRFLYGHLNYNEINFRVWKENVKKAVEGTKCEIAQNGNGGFVSGGNTGNRGGGGYGGGGYRKGGYRGQSYGSTRY